MCYTGEIMQDYIDLSHGAGGLKMDQLISFIGERITFKTVVEGIGNIGSDSLDDGAIISRYNFKDNDIVMTTDGHSVDPLFFPGGDIGKLSVCGTLNDLLMMGGAPVAITSALFIEEGFTFSELAKVLVSMDEILKNSKVPIIAGDTKVLPKGAIDKLLIVTTGIGKRITNEPILDSGTKVNDKIIVTGPIGSHGISLMSFRKGMEFNTELKSDCNYLGPLLLPLITKFPIHTMKDPTRGGLASALNEIASKSDVSLYINEEAIPIDPAVRSASEMLGLDPFEITCEGRAIITIAPEKADEFLKELQNHPDGKSASIIGEVKADNKGKVFLNTNVGGFRRLQKPIGEMIPRVC